MRKQDILSQEKISHRSCFVNKDISQSLTGPTGVIYRVSGEFQIEVLNLILMQTENRLGKLEVLFTFSVHSVTYIGPRMKTGLF